MKFKDLITITENKTNKQITANIKKKQLRKVGISVKDLLNMKLNKEVIDLKKPERR
jgi:hypothetical protein